MCFYFPGQLLGSANHHFGVMATGGYLWVCSHSLSLALSYEEGTLPPLSETSQRWG